MFFLSPSFIHLYQFLTAGLNKMCFMFWTNIQTCRSDTQSQAYLPSHYVKTRTETSWIRAIPEGEETEGSAEGSLENPRKEQRSPQVTSCQLDATVRWECSCKVVTAIDYMLELWGDHWEWRLTPDSTVFTWRAWKMSSGMIGGCNEQVWSKENKVKNLSPLLGLIHLITL